MHTWVQSQKWQNDICLFPRQTIQCHSNPSLCLNHYNAKEVGEWFYEDLQDLLELTPPKDVLFIIELEFESRKSRDTWSNRHIWPWSTEWSRAKANSILPREHTGHSKHPLPTTQEKTLHMDITRWPAPKSDRLYSLYSQQKQDRELTVAQIFLSIRVIIVLTFQIHECGLPFSFSSVVFFHFQGYCLPFVMCINFVTSFVKLMPGYSVFWCCCKRYQFWI